MRGQQILLLLAITALQLWAPLAVENDEAEENPRLILLSRRTIDTRAAPQFEDHLTAGTSEQPARHEPLTFLLHVTEEPEQRETLAEYLAENYETKLLDYVPHNTFVVEGTPDMMVDLKRRDEVVWVGILDPEDKLGVDHDNDDVDGDDVDSDDDNSQDTLNELVVSLTQVSPKRSIQTIDAIASSIRDLLLSSGQLSSTDELVVTPVHSKTNRVGITFGNAADRDAAERLISRMPIIAHVEKRLAMHFMNKWGRGILEAGLHVGPDLSDPNSLPSTRHNLRGQRQVIGVADSGLDTKHCFFRHKYGPSPYVKHVPHRKPKFTDLNLLALWKARKVVSYVMFADASDTSGHGTHVSGSLAGRADERHSRFHEFDGVANRARIAFFDIGRARGGRESLYLPWDIGDNLFHWTYVAGGRIHTNSWGSSSSWYTTLAADIDEYMWEHKDFLVLNSAGNGGGCGRRYSVGSPSTAKSVIAVGASMSNQESYARAGLPVNATLDEDDLAYFSSIGPTYDGRIKPDLVAPGDNIVSARNGGRSCDPTKTNLRTASGTSMASPLLAGTVALVRQYFTEGFYPTGERKWYNRFSPSGSLMKAAAIAGAVPIRGTRRNRCTKKVISFADARFPNIHHGWGRTQLDRVLKFSNDPASKRFRLHIPSYNKKRRKTFGDEVFTRRTQFIDYSFCYDPADDVAGDGPAVLRVVLVWTDAPGAPYSSRALVNDLDLEVFHHRCVVRGNDRYDRVNPVEVVEIPLTYKEKVDFRVRVKARAINVGPQPFSVVVVGPVRSGACKKGY